MSLSDAWEIPLPRLRAKALQEQDMHTAGIIFYDTVSFHPGSPRLTSFFVSPPHNDIYQVAALVIETRFHDT